MIDFLLGVPGKLKTISDYLTTYWTTTRAGYLDAAVTSRAPASTALSTATWDATKAGYLDTSVSTRAAASPLLLAPIAANFAPGWSQSAFTASTTYVNALSVTGSGVIHWVSGVPISGTGGVSIQLIVDGLTVFDGSVSSTLGQWVPVVGISDSGFTSPIWYDQIPFKTSLVINYKSSSGTTNVRAGWKIRRTS